MTADSPDFQVTIKVNTVPSADGPDWQLTATGPGGTAIGGYASLTGAGETTTPGLLTQDGGFGVNDTHADGGFGVITTDPAGISLTSQHNGPVAILSELTGGVSIGVGGGELVLAKGFAFNVQTDIATGAALTPGDVLTVISQGPVTAVAGWAAPAPSSGYASLTGAGETVTPGDLTQAGALTVTNAGANDTFINNTPTASGDIRLEQDGSGHIVLETQASAAGITLSDAGAGGVYIQTTGTGTLWLEDDGTGGVQIQGKAAGTLGFFGATPVTKQATPVTLGDVIALLQAYGLST